MTFRQNPPALLRPLNNRHDVFGSMAAMTPTQHENLAPNLVAAYHKLKAGKTKKRMATIPDALSNTFSISKNDEVQKADAKKLAPPSGSPAGQSTALAQILQMMKPEFNGGGTL